MLIFWWYGDSDDDDDDNDDGGGGCFLQAADGVALGQPLEDSNLISDDDDDNTDTSNHSRSAEEPYSNEVRQMLVPSFPPFFKTVSF